MTVSGRIRAQPDRARRAARSRRAWSTARAARAVTCDRGSPEVVGPRDVMMRSAGTGSAAGATAITALRGAGMTASHDLLTLRNNDHFPVSQRYGPGMP